MLKLVSRRQALLALGDMAIITACLFGANYLRLGVVENLFDTYTGATGLILLSFLSVFYIADAYNLQLNFRSAVYIARFAGASLLGAMLAAMTFYLFPHWKYGRGIWLIFCASSFLLLVAWRVFFELAFKAKRRARKLLIVGNGAGGRRISDAVRRGGEYEVVGIIDGENRLLGPGGEPAAGPDAAAAAAGEGAEAARCPSLRAVVDEKKVDAVVVSTGDLRDGALVGSLVSCKMQGTHVYDMPGFFEEELSRIPIHHIDDRWILSVPLFGVSRDLYNARVKRVVDVALALLGIALSLPVMLAVAAAVKLSSRGPVLYRQTRVGLGDREFSLVKFRSMRADAEKDGARWAAKGDARVTGLGRVIRTLRVDEIPQFFNVLKGEMSFIGPRPERPEFVRELDRIIPYYSMRHAVRPGITGWAQVNYAYGASVQDAIEKLQYDLFYIKNCNAMLDIRILLKTIRVVLFGFGAR